MSKAKKSSSKTEKLYYNAYEPVKVVLSLDELKNWTNELLDSLEEYTMFTDSQQKVVQHVLDVKSDDLETLVSEGGPGLSFLVTDDWVEKLLKVYYSFDGNKDEKTKKNRQKKLLEYIKSTASSVDMPPKVSKKPKAAKTVPKKPAKSVPKKSTPKKATKKEPKKITTTQCLKVGSLRKETKDPSITLESWMEEPDNVYVGRFGRIFIGTGDDKRIFHYKGSKFANPYKVGTKDGEYTLEKSLELYKKHLVKKGLVDDVKRELAGKNLGCFCDQKYPCHAKVLADIANDTVEEELPKEKTPPPKKAVKKVKEKTPSPKKVAKAPVKKVVKAKASPKKVTKAPAKKAKKPKIIVCQFGRGVAYPQKEGFKNYPIHSKGAKPWKELSPFLIGPVEFINSEGKLDSCPIFENFWQGSKVWKNVTKQSQKKPEWNWPAEKHIGPDGDPNKKWEIWHESLLHHEKPVRRPNGKAIPEYAWWLNEDTGEYEKLDTVQARKKIYIPILKELYRAHPVYQKMLKEFRGGQDMILIEPDGPWAEAYPEGREVTLELLGELVEKMNYKEEGYPKQYHPFGHGLVCAMCLLEDY